MSCKDILADIQFRGKTSDWEPAKATFVDYVDGDKPKEELEVLLVVDEDNVYGDNFYLCKNEETVASCPLLHASAVRYPGLTSAVLLNQAAEIIEKFTKKDETATEGEAAAEAQVPIPPSIFHYALATPCPILIGRMVLPRHFPIVLCTCYALSSTCCALCGTNTARVLPGGGGAST